MTERTLVLIKPDAVARGYVGEILSRIERKGLTIAALDLRVASEEVAGSHYAETRRASVLPELVGVHHLRSAGGRSARRPPSHRCFPSVGPAEPTRSTRLFRVRSAATSDSKRSRTSFTAATPWSRQSVKSLCGSPRCRPSESPIGPLAHMNGPSAHISTANSRHVSHIGAPFAVAGALVWDYCFQLNRNLFYARSTG